MKRKLTVILATFVVTMGLLLGTSAAQEATVIFEEGTNKAIAIRNLDFEGTLYNVVFTPFGTTAQQVYGDFPGQFDFRGSPSEDAAIAVNRELNLAGATGVGAEGSFALPFYWIGFGSERVEDNREEVNVVLYQKNHAACPPDDDDRCIWGNYLGSLAPYDSSPSVWADFTEASKDLQVIFEGNNATGIRNLEVDGKLYDVEFVFDSAENIYGETLIFDFQDDAQAASSAVRTALNSEPAVETVGPEEADVYKIGFNVNRSFVDVTQDYWQAPTSGPWIQGDQTILYRQRRHTYADFTEVTAPPNGDVVQVFVTDTTYVGDIGGLAGADAKCQERAERAGLTGTWTAWLSTTTEDAIDRIPDGQYELVDGTVIAEDKADLTDGTLNAPINLNQDGNPIPGDFVWTGTNLLGRSTGTNCSNWTTTGGDRCVDGDPDCGDRGLNTATNPDWTKVGGAPNPCDNLFHLYCFGGGE